MHLATHAGISYPVWSARLKLFFFSKNILSTDICMRLNGIDGHITNIVFLLCNFAVSQSIGLATLFNQKGYKLVYYNKTFNEQAIEHVYN